MGNYELAAKVAEVLQKRAGKISGATSDRKKYKEIGEGYGTKN